MKRSVRIGLTAVLTLVFLISGFRFVQSQREKSHGNSTYEAAQQLAAESRQDVPQSASVTEEPAQERQPQWMVAPIEEDDPHIKTLEAMDLTALREVNPDVVGWILIPDTEINYPLLQGPDNDYYLQRTWDHKSNAMGSIFLECMNLPELTNYNTIVYGHNMNDGSMFADIREYRNLEFWKNHPYVYILSDFGVYRYEVFSSYPANVKGIAYTLMFPDKAARTKFLDSVIASSSIDTGLRPEDTDRILTLSTCHGAGYSHRWVVHARLKMVLQ